MNDATGADGGFAAIIQRESGLQRTLSARKLSMIAIGGAIGTGLFLGSGFAIGTAGPGVLLSYAIGALIALLLMGCLAEMTIVHPTTGSFGAYARNTTSVRWPVSWSATPTGPASCWRWERKSPRWRFI